MPAPAVRPIADWQRAAAPREKHSFSERCSYVSLLAASPMPITRFGQRLVGTAFPGATPIVLFRNVLARPVALQVEATWTTPGARVRVMREPSGSDAAQVDELVNAGAGVSQNLSRAVILDGGATLYAANATPGGLALVAGDVFRTLVWDPWAHVERDF